MKVRGERERRGLKGVGFSVHLKTNDPFQRALKTKTRSNLLAVTPNRFFVKGDSEKMAMGREVWYDG